MEAHAKRTEKSITWDHDLWGKGRRSRLQQQHRQRPVREKVCSQEAEVRKREGRPEGRAVRPYRAAAGRTTLRSSPQDWASQCYWQVRWLVVQDYPWCVGCSAASCPTPGQKQQLILLWVCYFVLQSVQYDTVVPSYSQKCFQIPQDTGGKKLPESLTCNLVDDRHLCPGELRLGWALSQWDVFKTMVR